MLELPFRDTGAGKKKKNTAGAWKVYQVLAVIELKTQHSACRAFELREDLNGVDERTVTYLHDKDYGLLCRSYYLLWGMSSGAGRP
jgi:hypothetical protein